MKKKVLILSSAVLMALAFSFEGSSNFEENIFIDSDNIAIALGARGPQGASSGSGCNLKRSSCSYEGRQYPNFKNN